MTSKLLDEFGAAALIGMSPALLRYLTSHQAKWKDKRKLKTAKEVAGTLFFEETELKEYDAWLKAPWPSRANLRPPLPPGIRSEIREEANLECALCKSSGEAGEAAHIKPVATSKSNHPHNLIWLCSNHHTKLDNGSFGPKGHDNEVIVALKASLHHFKKQAWLGQAQVLTQIAATLSLCGELQKQLTTAKTAIDIEAIEGVAKKALELIPSLASKSYSDTVQSTLTQMTTELTKKQSAKSPSTKAQLQLVSSYEKDFLLSSGLVSCPLCNGTKIHDDYDCPVCQGDGAIAGDLEVDLTDFELVNCQLCKGVGRYEGSDCPGCGGDGKLERRFVDRIDYSQYESAPCPLCDGKRRLDGEDCPACHGEGAMPRGIAEQIVLDDYGDVDCPLCEGTGSYDGDSCPECHGNRKMPRRYAEQVEISKYKLQRCPLCRGKKQYAQGECPVCNGDGEIPGYATEQLDLSRFEIVKCPCCNGTRLIDGEECEACGGEGEMQRRHTERFD